MRVCIWTNCVVEHEFALGMIYLCLIYFPFFLLCPSTVHLTFLERKVKEWGERKYHASMGNKKSIVTLLKKQTRGFHLFELNFNFKAKH